MLLKLNMYSCESMNMIEKLNQEHDLALSENVESKKEYNKIFDMIWDCLYKYGFIMRYPLDPNEEHLKILIKDYEKIQEKDQITISGLDQLTQGKLLTVTLKHEGSGSDEITVEHTLNEKEIQWFYHGSALNYVGSQK